MAYGWDDLKVEHGHFDSKQGSRYTIDESTRHELLQRLLKLNHVRHAIEKENMLSKKKATPPKKKKKSQKAAAGLLFDDEG